MPQPHTHYIAAELSMQEAVPYLWQNHGRIPLRNIAGFNSFLKDLFYMLDLPFRVALRYNLHLPSTFLERLPGIAPNYPNHDYSAVSDIMHWEGSLDFVVNSMEYIKQHTEPNSETRNKLKAALYGSICHMVPDARIHPYIYRQTRDHWKIHTKRAYDRHKKLESRIDSYLLGRTPPGFDQFNFNYPDKVICHEGDSGRALDEDLFMFISHALRNTYARFFEKYGLNYQELLGRFEGKDTNPILDAYRDYITAVRWLWQGRVSRILPERVSVLVPVRRFRGKELVDFDPISSIKREKWIKSRHDGMPSYSIRELFELSVREAKNVIQVLEKFFESDETGARAFLARHADVPFLAENINFDTGLPSRMNEELLEIDKRHGVNSGLIARVDTPPIQIPSLEEIAHFGLDYLNSTYRAIETLK